MTSVLHEPSRTVAEPRHWTLQVLVPEMWAFLAIVVIWLTVLFDAVFGPDIKTNNGVADIGNSATIPSAVVVALFAFLATWVVARYAFGRTRTE